MEKIKSIEGSSTPFKINTLLDENNVIISNPIDIANALASTYQKNSSDTNYDTDFLKYKYENNNLNTNITDNNSSPLNSLITFSELKKTLKECKNTSPGPDKIPNNLLKNLPDKALSYLLKIYNTIWSHGVFPKQWSESIIIPIRKPGKDKRQLTNYRPIALTCTLCKLLEKIINKRLKWFLEKNQLLDENQNGTRQKRSTTDALINLETSICDAFINNQHLLTVCLDVEKAYEMVWRNHIIQTLSNYNVKGKILIFIQNFLQNRYIQVRVNNHLSEKIKLENGVPQGSVLSPTLFLISFNDVSKCFETPVKCSIYADDITAYCKGKNLDITENTMQKSLNSLQNWSKTTGYKFSSTKSNCIIFSKAKPNAKNPQLKINNQILPITNTIKILGLNFDNQLKWTTHITELKNSCKRKLNIIKTLAKRNWGADQKLLINTYIATIRSKFDYCCPIYSSAKPNELEKLSPIHNSALRISLGAFCTSPVDCILSEALQPPLNLRRTNLRLITASKIASTPTNPAYKNIFEGKYQQKYNESPNYPQPFYHRITQDLASINSTLPQISYYRPHFIPPWQIVLPQINLELQKLSKKNTEPILYRTKFEELKSKFLDYTHIYTDGSKTKTGAGCSVHTSEINLQFKLPKFYPIIKCETYALLKALNFIYNSNDKKFIIFTDSLSGIKAIQNFTKYDKITQRIQELSTKITEKRKEVILIWIPSHIGIPGNETADTLAKTAHTLETIDETAIIEPQDLKGFFKKK